MDRTYIIKECIKIFYICLISYFIYIKISSYKNHLKINNIIILLASGFISLLYACIYQYISPSVAMIVSFYFYGIIMNLTIKNEINSFVIGYIIAIVIAYIIYLLATIISGIVVKLLFPSINFTSNIWFFVILTIASCILKFISKIKRFRNGFNFLKNDNLNKHIIVFTAFFSGIIVLFFSLLQEVNDIIKFTWLFIGIVLIMISIIYWIKSEITKHYKNNMRDRTIEIQKQEIDEHIKTINNIKDENLKLSSVIHKYNNRISSIENSIRKTINLNTNVEFENELSIMLEEVKTIAKDFAKETTIITKKLHKTNIVGIDNMFEYMQEEANKNNINFDLKINGSINSLVENIIEKGKFETLIGDHLRDAIIAINSSDNSYKSILVVLGMVDGYYEFSVYDTGIEFEIETLLKLGLERVTTHKEEGGSGIGFMTTFETMKESKASLIIEEYNPETTNYTKSVNIRFDGKNEYRIYSYRADEIKKKNKDNRIIVEKI